MLPPLCKGLTKVSVCPVGTRPEGAKRAEGRGPLSRKAGKRSLSTGEPRKSSQAADKRATRRRLFAYFFWKKHDPFLVGTSRRRLPLSLPFGQPAPLCEGEPRRSSGTSRRRLPLSLPFGQPAPLCEGEPRRSSGTSRRRLPLSLPLRGGKARWEPRPRHLIKI